MALLTRRAALTGGLTGSSLLLAGCSQAIQADRLTGAKAFQQVLDWGQDWTLHSQRFLLGGGALAREYRPSDISKVFKANGTLNTDYYAYNRAVSDG